MTWAQLALRRTRIPSRTLVHHAVPANVCKQALKAAGASNSLQEKMIPFRLVLSSPLHVGRVPHRNYSSTSPALKDYPEHTLFPMPALSPTMETGTIASWARGEGDSFSAGDVLCSIETDKASVDFEAQDDGILAKILRQGKDAEDIRIGTPICVVVEDANDVAAFADFQVSQDDPPIVSVPATEESVAPSPIVPTAAASSPLMPAARHLSESKKLDATVLTGSGKGGRVTKGDVLKALAAGVSLPPLMESSSPKPAVTAADAPVSAAAAPKPSAAPVFVPSGPMADVPIIPIETLGTYEDIPNSKMRKIIASRLTESKREVPHFYATVQVELDNVMKLRKMLQTNHDVKVSINDFIIRCCALALRDVPEVNASYDRQTGHVKLNPTIDVSVAVATPTGLITPIVPNTDTLGLSAITDKVRDLALRARDGKLSPQEYQGGTFCVSNLGMFGIKEFSAVINPPQAAILAVGGGIKMVLPTPYIDGAPKQAKPSVRTVMTARLSADRRVVDEPTACLFLSVFRGYMTQPELLML